MAQPARHHSPSAWTAPAPLAGAQGGRAQACSGRCPEGRRNGLAARSPAASTGKPSLRRDGKLLWSGDARQPSLVPQTAPLGCSVANGVCLKCSSEPRGPGEREGLESWQRRHHCCCKAGSEVTCRFFEKSSSEEGRGVCGDAASDRTRAKATSTSVSSASRAVHVRAQSQAEKPAAPSPSPTIAPSPCRAPSCAGSVARGVTVRVGGGAPGLRGQTAHLVIHALCGHALVVGQSGDLSAFRGFHPAAAKGHLLEAVRLPHVGTVGQPCSHTEGVRVTAQRGPGPAAQPGGGPTVRPGEGAGTSCSRVLCFPHRRNTCLPRLASEAQPQSKHSAQLGRVWRQLAHFASRTSLPQQHEEPVY